jgi:hypothetical protein
MMTDLLTQEQAADLLSSHSGSLHGCIDRAWGRWLKNPDTATASKRTRAATVYDYITDEVQRTFSDVEGVTFAWKHGSLHMTIANAAVIKFKKFRTQQLRTSGIATNARNLFLQQAGVLDGMVVTHLVVGYLLDELELTPETIAVTCPLGGGNLWVLPLGPDCEAGQGAAPTPIVSESPGRGSTVIRSSKETASDALSVNEE